VGARSLVPELVAAAFGRRPRQAEREIAAMLLTDLGGHLDLGGQDGGAAQLYQRALELDPAQRAALLGLAAVHEKRGGYREALPLLDRLVSLDPTHREGRLRRALVLQRTGRGAESEAPLRALAAGGGDWVQSLAAQEAARLLLARGDGAGAVAMLEPALLDLPCDPGLPVVAAFASERAGGAQPLDLATLADCGEAAGSARARYARPSSSELQPLARRLATADEEWRAALRRALARVR
jgi:tetratricopeptide (TPR) repeat protein